MKVIYIVILIYLQIDGMYRLYKNARSINKNIQLLFLIASVINDGRKDNTEVSNNIIHENRSTVKIFKC